MSGFVYRLLLSSLFLAAAVTGRARTVTYDLTVAEQTVRPAGRPVRGLTLNGSSPGPVLRFREGDTASIHLHNGLKNEQTSLHWHGLLLPNLEDGVPRLTTPVIPPGASRTYEFPLRQSGTYWYHSHTGLQEQQGVFGAIVVEPRGGERVRADREYVLVLSDWTNEKPEQVMKALMRGTEWYGIRKGSAQSVWGALKSGHFKDYWSREWSGMPPMDVSDVAYDAFLINGQRRLDLDARPGERVRLRVINAGAATYFYVQSATGPLTIVAADGPPVQPVKQQRLLMGIAETYDLLMTVPAAGAWEFRATAQDGSGHASAFLGRGPRQAAPDVPRLNPYDMEGAMGAVLDAMEAPAAVTDARALAEEPPRPLSPYPRLKSVVPTALPAGAPRRTIPLHLTGDMIRYTWSINGKPLKEESTIRIRRGEVLRLELSNDTMMHHPMHLHGHFFRLLTDPEHPGPDAPLKHTVDVPPMSRRTIEFAASEHGDWFFHCHILYHMESGMARVFSYDDQGPDHQPDIFCDCLPDYRLFLEGSLQSHMSEGMISLMNAKNEFGILWNAGWARMEETEYRVDLMASRYLNSRWSAFSGFRLTNRMDEENRFMAGARRRLPLRAELVAGADSRGDVMAALSKRFQLTSRLSVSGNVEFDTGTAWMWSAGAAYTLSKNFSLTVSHDSTYGFGGGVAFRF